MISRTGNTERLCGTANQAAINAPPTSAASATPAARQRPSVLATPSTGASPSAAAPSAIASGRCSAIAIPTTPIVIAATRAAVSCGSLNVFIAHTAPRWTHSPIAIAVSTVAHSRGTPSRTPRTRGDATNQPGLPAASGSSCARTSRDTTSTATRPRASTNHNHSDSVATSATRNSLLAKPTGPE